MDAYKLGVHSFLPDFQIIFILKYRCNKSALQICCQQMLSIFGYMQINIAGQLQRLRKEKGITRDVLASHLGVSPQAVSKWENGSYPDGDLLPQIADFFGVSIDHLYSRATNEISLEQRILERTGWSRNYRS